MLALVTAVAGAVWDAVVDWGIVVPADSKASSPRSDPSAGPEGRPPAGGGGGGGGQGGPDSPPHGFSVEEATHSMRELERVLLSASEDSGDDAVSLSFSPLHPARASYDTLTDLSTSGPASSVNSSSRGVSRRVSRGDGWEKWDEDSERLVGRVSRTTFGGLPGGEWSGGMPHSAGSAGAWDGDSLRRAPAEEAATPNRRRARRSRISSSSRPVSHNSRLRRTKSHVELSLAGATRAFASAAAAPSPGRTRSSVGGSTALGIGHSDSARAALGVDTLRLDLGDIGAIAISESGSRAAEGSYTSLRTLAEAFAERVEAKVSGKRRLRRCPCLLGPWLSLRPHLTFYREWIYYSAIVINVPMRVVWVLTLTPFAWRSVQHVFLLPVLCLLEFARRVMWTILVVEHEHYKSSGGSGMWGRQALGTGRANQEELLRAPVVLRGASSDEWGGKEKKRRQEEERSGSIWWDLLIVLGTLTLTLLGSTIFERLGWK